MTRALLIVCAVAGAARAEDFVPLLERPLTLPRQSISATIAFPYTNWSNGRGSATGFSLTAGVDFGISDQAQLGTAAAIAVDPGAGFGSLLLSGALFWLRLH